MQPFLHYLKTNAANVDSSFNSKSVRRPKYLLMLLLPFFVILAQAPFVAVQGQISLDRVVPAEICVTTDPTTGAVVFTPFGSFTAGNVFTAQLSDAAGSFTNATTVGTLAATTGRAMRIDIPGGLAAGNYLIRVTSSTPPFTSSTLPFVINAPSGPPPSIEISTQGNVSFCGTDDGFFTLRISPRANGQVTGATPFTFTLAPAVPGSQTSEPKAPYKFSNLPQNTYGIIMTDNDGCASNIIAPIVISKDTALTVRVGSYQKPGCGASDGQMVVFADYGSHNSYRYSLSGAATRPPQNGHRFTGLPAGDYVITVTDSRGCPNTLNFTLPSKSCPPGIAAGSTDNLSAATLKSALKLQALPNPSKTNFTLNLQGGSQENVQIIVTDMVGKKIYQTTGSSNRQYTFGQEFKSGVYIVQVIQGKQTQTVKLVKGN